MTILVYIGIAAVLFIIGTIFLLKGIPDEEEKAVPIENPREIRELRAAFSPSEKMQAEVFQKPDVQAEEGLGSNQFMAENHQLRKEILDQKERYEQLERRIADLQKEHNQVQKNKEEMVRAFEEENKTRREEKEQSSLNNEALNEMKAKIGLLQAQYAESQKQQEEMRAVIGQLKTEKDDLLERAKRHEQQMVEQRSVQDKEAHRAEFGALSDKLSESISTIEGLKRENKDLLQANEDLRNEFKKIEALNAQLMKKEKMMQYELTKNRAQALGLERICADFRTQIETMAATASSEK